MDNAETEEQLIVLSTIDEESFENCTEIIIADEAHANGDVLALEQTIESGGVLDETSETISYSKDVDGSMDEDVNDSMDEGEKKMAGGQHLMLNSIEDLKEVLEDYFERTATRFVGWRKTKNFGLPSSECSLAGHQVQWCDTVRNTNNGLDNLVPFDGIPYMIVGHYDMDCQFGNDRNKSGKAKRLQKKEAGLIKTKYTHVFANPSKRCGCPAKISIKQIIRFPEFKIDSDSKWKKNDRSLKLKMKLKECREKVKMEVYYVGRLPEVYEHKHLNSTKPSEAVLQELVVLAQEFYLEEKNYSQIQQRLHQHVIENLFWNKSPPHRSRRRFYPTLQDLRYFCTRAIHLLRFSDEEQDYMRKVISDIEAKGNVNVSFILSESKIIRMDEAAADENDSSVCTMDPSKKMKKSDERKIQSFIFCSQTDTQRRLLKRFSNVAFLVEVVDKQPKKNAASYRFYAVIVQTNIDYQVCACLATSKQKKDGLCEGLKLLREWNPTWNPKYFMVDCAPAIYEAVTIVFPESQYFLNPQSCEEKWLEYFTKPSNMLQDNAEEIMKYLKTMQYSLTEDSLSVAAALLEASNIWHDRDNLREWFQSNWLPCAKQWVFGYRPEDLLILQHTKATIEDCLIPFTEELRKAYKFKGFMELIERVCVSIPTAEYEKYVERNKRAHIFYQHYSKTNSIPHYVRNMPISLLPYIKGVCELAETTNFGILRDSFDAFTVKYNPDENEDDTDNSNEFSYYQIGIRDASDFILKNQIRPATEGSGPVENEPTKDEMKLTETDFGWIEHSNKVVPGDNTISFGDSFSHPFCTCSHWLLYRIPCVHMVAIFFRTTGWRYDMMSPLYRSNPLHEIDYSVLEFPIEKSLSFPIDCDKEVQTNPLATFKDLNGLADGVLEVPTKIWDYFIVLTQTRDFLKHLDKMAFLFTDKNLHLKFRQQVSDVITQLENDAVRKRGQKIEFTTRNLSASRQTLLEKARNGDKQKSQGVASGGGNTKKIIVKNCSQLDVGGEKITGIYRVGGKEGTKIGTLKQTNGDGVETPCPKTDFSSSTIPSLSVLSNSVPSSASSSTSPDNSKLVILNNVPLTKDVCENMTAIVENSRKRKLTVNAEEVNTSKNENSNGNATEKHLAKTKEPNDLPPPLKKMDYLSVLKYLPLLKKGASQKELSVSQSPSQSSSTQTSDSKTTSNMNLLKCLPPNVGLTRCVSASTNTSVKDVNISPLKEDNLVTDDKNVNFPTVVPETDVKFTPISSNDIHFTTETENVDMTSISDNGVGPSTDESVEQTVMYILSETLDSENIDEPEKDIDGTVDPPKDNIPIGSTNNGLSSESINIVAPDETAPISSQELATTLSLAI